MNIEKLLTKTKGVALAVAFSLTTSISAVGEETFDLNGYLSKEQQANFVNDAIIIALETTYDVVLDAIKCLPDEYHTPEIVEFLAHWAHHTGRACWSKLVTPSQQTEDCVTEPVYAAENRIDVEGKHFQKNTRTNATRIKRSERGKPVLNWKGTSKGIGHVAICAATPTITYNIGKRVYNGEGDIINAKIFGKTVHSSVKYILETQVPENFWEPKNYMPLATAAFVDSIGSNMWPELIFAIQERSILKVQNALLNHFHVEEGLLAVVGTLVARYVTMGLISAINGTENENWLEEASPIAQQALIGLVRTGMYNYLLPRAKKNLGAPITRNVFSYFGKKFSSEPTDDEA